MNTAGTTAKSNVICGTYPYNSPTLKFQTGPKMYPEFLLSIKSITVGSVIIKIEFINLIKAPNLNIFDCILQCFSIITNHFKLMFANNVSP